MYWRNIDGVNEELTVLKNIVRVGTISSVNAKDRTARVNFADKNNLVSGALKILKTPPLVTVKNTSLPEEHGHEVTISPWLPSVGDLVLCIYLPNGESDGFVIGGI